MAYVYVKHKIEKKDTEAMTLAKSAVFAEWLPENYNLVRGINLRCERNENLVGGGSTGGRGFLMGK